MRMRGVTIGLAAVLVIAAAPAGASVSNGATASQTFLVVYKASEVPANAETVIKEAGGSLAYSYGQIGVAIATSSNPSFATEVAKDQNVDGAAATKGFGTRLDPAENAGGPGDPLPDSAPASDTDSLSGLQWDMVQMHAPEAHAITGGSPSVVVGDIDTGLDYTHPDLAANVDFAKSVSCVGGVPDQNPSAWMDDNGHGTHTAGTIAAAANGVGIVGVAPNVKIAGIKAGNAAGYFFPEAVVCAFMWAGDQRIPVTNNSYFADPWLFNCRNDADQRAIWTAERRAIAYAQKQGDVVVAAAGNQADDLAHPTQDATSPDDTNPVLRDIANNCAVVPTEVPGVVGVAAVGNRQLKSFYSSYGVGAVDVTAPGGDSVLQLTPAAPNGRVLSTWPSALLTSTCAASRRVVDASGATYCYQQGTSMASPHVAGLAALIFSHYGKISAKAVAAKLQNTADPLPCPSDTSIYGFFPAVDNGAAQTCQGGRGYNSFNGHGQVNALTAVTG